MFQSRYVSNISQRSYIRQRYSAFNIASTLNRTNDNTATDSNDHDIIDIYDEDEEMTPTIDTESAESEEVSEDDIAFKSDRGGNENESDEETSEEASDEEIIDQPLNNEQLPHFTQSNEFNPYFNNITESLFFCWMQKHRISTQAYDELVDIICHLQFKKDDVVPNSRRFRKYRWRESKEAKRLGRILVIIQQDGQLKIKIQRILIFEDLPGNLQSNNRKQRSQEGELWFMD
ncbi:unnamed protein product [Rhizophagus irregularis]|uniref:Uncharacterized protein n=1 Tax=Rhizophagus irregularis TaxID=588596 RepID=A0A916E375_9GLOM|nr:unnamed protein product [Rhizophagus irregularis]